MIEMRKGFTLIEILVVLIILPFVLLLLDGLFMTLLGEIPKSYTIAQENLTVQHFLEQLQQDMDKATGLPASFEEYTADNSQILIELQDGIVCYLQKDGQVIRRKLTGAEHDNIRDERAWSLPHAKIQWQIRMRNGREYAVEVKTHIEYKTEGRWKKTMANSHLYYGGVLR
jgi:prepilin-type N-terminal cleavage/methylation domain-containing protein